MPIETLNELGVEQYTTQNRAMERCLRLAGLASKAEVPVLILGETGTGKTLLAQAIHHSSRRAKGPFISFNASAMTETLLESGKGKFELADLGTLFFDEIAELSPLAQTKILRAVEYGEFERVGAERSLRSNARIISATNCSLRERIHQGRFREDLYHRLNGLTLLVPPLRERQEDLPALVATGLRSAAEDLGKNIASLHREAMNKLLSYSWPGNLRELHHTMRTVALFCDDEVVLPDHVVFDADLAPQQAALNTPSNGGVEHGFYEPPVAPLQEDLSLSSALLRHVQTVYQKAQWNQRRAAKMLSISRATLARYLRKLPEQHPQ